eukprot:12639545-Alexandrium_andersonii.AAC.1
MCIRDSIRPIRPIRPIHPIRPIRPIHPMHPMPRRLFGINAGRYVRLGLRRWTIVIWKPSWGRTCIRPPGYPSFSAFPLRRRRFAWCEAGASNASTQLSNSCGARSLSCAAPGTASTWAPKRA